MSLKIDRNNYEAYLLDLLEGRLSQDGRRRLREFLSRHPDCGADLEVEELWTLDPGSASFPGKQSLKKEIPSPGQPMRGSHFGLLSIARLEGDLSEDRIREHEEKVAADRSLLKEWEAWQQTRLPRRSIPFPRKEDLKKPEKHRRLIPWVTVSAAAAAIALLLVVLTTRTPSPLPMSQEYPVVLPGHEQERAVPAMVPPPLPDPLPGLSGGEVRGAGLAAEQAPTKISTPLHPSVRQAAAEDPEAGGGRAQVEHPEHDMPLLSRSILAARLPAAPVQPGTYDRIRPLYLPPSTVNQRNISLSSLASMDLQEVVEEYAREKDLSLWSVASAGIRGINRITGSDLQLYAARDEEGEVSGFQFKSRNLNISSPLDKSED